MRVTKASAYAVLASVFIARNGHDAPIQGRLIAEANHLPAEYLLKILQNLVRAQLLSSETGRRGGFSLRKSPKEINLLDIVEAIDGPIATVLPTHSGFDSCDELRVSLQQVFSAIAMMTRSILSNLSLEGLVSQENTEEVIAASMASSVPASQLVGNRLLPASSP